jgi:hypothetical protein
VQAQAAYNALDAATKPDSHLIPVDAIRTDAARLLHVDQGTVDAALAEVGTEDVNPAQFAFLADQMRAAQGAPTNAGPTLDQAAIDGPVLASGKANDPEAVKRLQTQLQTLGLYAGEVDGKFGPQTEAAVKAFQTSVAHVDANDAPDGKVGPITQTALQTAVAGHEAAQEHQAEARQRLQDLRLQAATSDPAMPFEQAAIASAKRSVADQAAFRRATAFGDPFTPQGLAPISDQAPTPVENQGPVPVAETGDAPAAPTEVVPTVTPDGPVVADVTVAEALDPSTKPAGFDPQQLEAELGGQIHEMEGRILALFPSAADLPQMYEHLKGMTPGKPATEALARAMAVRVGEAMASPEVDAWRNDPGNPDHHARLEALRTQAEEVSAALRLDPRLVDVVNDHVAALNLSL